MTDPARTLTLARPDDWHLHLRDGEALAAVVAASAPVEAESITATTYPITCFVSIDVYFIVRFSTVPL